MHAAGQATHLRASRGLHCAKMTSTACSRNPKAQWGREWSHSEVQQCRSAQHPACMQRASCGCCPCCKPQRSLRTCGARSPPTSPLSLAIFMNLQGREWGHAVIQNIL